MIYSFFCGKVKEKELAVVLEMFDVILKNMIPFLYKGPLLILQSNKN